MADAPLTATATSFYVAVGNGYLGMIDRNVANFTDANLQASWEDFTATVTWGDGSWDSNAYIESYGNGSFGVFDSHPYAEPGTYTVAVAIADEGGSTASVGNSTAQVGQTLSGQLTGFSATEGVSSTGDLADIRDIDPSATLTSATVDWGGQPVFDSSPTFVADGNGGYYVQDTIYASEEGAFLPNVTVQDSDGNSIQLLCSVTVADAPLTAAGANFNTTEGSTYTGPVATFTDANGMSQSGDFTVEITWDNGRQSPGSVMGGGGSFTVYGTHTYTEEGAHPLSVQITDNGGSTASATATATVADAALTAGSTGIMLTGQTISDPVAAFTDANIYATSNDFTAAITRATARSPGFGAGGNYTVYGYHTYAATGMYPISVSITDDGGSTTPAYNNATVLLAGQGTAFAAVEGESSSGTLADIHDLELQRHLQRHRRLGRRHHAGYRRGPSCPDRQRRLLPAGYAHLCRGRNELSFHHHPGQRRQLDPGPDHGHRPGRALDGDGYGRDHGGGRRTVFGPGGQLHRRQPGRPAQRFLGEQYDHPLGRRQHVRRHHHHPARRHRDAFQGVRPAHLYRGRSHRQSAPGYHHRQGRRGLQHHRLHADRLRRTLDGDGDRRDHGGGRRPFSGRCC